MIFQPIRYCVYHFHTIRLNVYLYIYIYRRRNWQERFLIEKAAITQISRGLQMGDDLQRQADASGHGGTSECS